MICTVCHVVVEELSLKVAQFTMLIPKVTCYTQIFYIKNERIGRIENFQNFMTDIYHVITIIKNGKNRLECELLLILFILVLH